jgi:hypothetical protein
MNAVLVVIMLSSGVQQGSTIKLESTTSCREEINTVNHMNTVFKKHGSEIEYKIVECKK